MKIESKGKNRWLPSIKDAHVCALKKKEKKKSVISKKFLKIKKKSLHFFLVINNLTKISLLELFQLKPYTEFINTV